MVASTLNRARDDWTPQHLFVSDDCALSVFWDQGRRDLEAFCRAARKASSSLVLTPRPALTLASDQAGNGMANTEQLIEAICRVVELSPNPIPIALMNHGVDEAAAIIGGVVERCAGGSIALKRVSIDPELAEELGLTEGEEIEHGARPTIHCEPGLGRQVLFEKV
jgi:hypothetical protein